jgi:putative transposase
VKALSGVYGVSACCRALEVPRSTACYRRKARGEVDLSRLKLVVQTLLASLRGYGVLRMYLELRGLGVATTRRSVRRAYLEMGLLKKPHRRRRVRTTDSRHNDPVYPDLAKGLQAQAPDHVWVADVTYVRIGSRFAYLALLMDVYTRQILGWHAAFANDTSLTLAALRAALSTGRKPRIHHSDQGSNYASKLYVLEVQATKALMSMAQAGKPQDNGYAERLNRTVKEEEVLHSEYQSLEDLREGLAAYVQIYNERRIHSSLGYRKPSEVFRQWMQNQQGSPP